MSKKIERLSYDAQRRADGDELQLPRIPSSGSSPTSRRRVLQSLAGFPILAVAGRTTALAATVSEPATLPVDAIVPFEVNVPRTSLDDLKHRLASARWPDRETVDDWSQGVPLAKARSLIEHWENEYDWRRFERRINGYPQFRTKIDGLGIHFIHVRSKHPDALPIILTHGWPGSVVEFLDVIGPMTDPTAHGGRPEDAFHVVIPSLPGFGWSDKPKEAGWNVIRIAKAWGALMQRLGYGRWVAQGGDWGAGVTHALGLVRPTGLIAAHVNWAFVVPEKLPDNPTPEEKATIAGLRSFTGDQVGYFREMATRPQTVGYGLADSPVGQAAWIYEKFQAWTDNHGKPEDALSADQMLDNISVYWFTNTAASSARIYWENAREAAAFDFGRIELPMAATMFPREIFRVPKSWAQARWPNLIYWNEVDIGGHFAAFEQPQLFSQEMRKAFRSVR